MSNTIRIVSDAELGAVTGGNEAAHDAERVVHGLVQQWYKAGGGDGNPWNAIVHINNQGNLLGHSMGADRAAHWIRSFVEGK